MITSLRNDKVRLVQALQNRRRARQREQRCVFEGVRLVEETVRVHAPVSFVLYTAAVSSTRRGERLLAALREAAIPCHQVSAEVMAACSATETPQGILAVLPLPAPPPPEHPRLTLVLDRVRDPGNLGTILRTAWAAGVERVLLAPGTVDATNPKVIRAAMGAHLHLPLAALRWEEIAREVAGCAVYLAAADGDLPYTEADWSFPVVLIVGGEADGPSPQAESLATGRVRIPMAPGMESLNVAVATAVLLFEAVAMNRVHRPRRPRG